MKNKYKLSLDEYIVLRLVHDNLIVSFDEIVNCLRRYRKDVERIITGLIEDFWLTVYDPNAYAKTKVKNEVIPIRRAKQEARYKAIKQTFLKYDLPQIDKYENICFVENNWGFGTELDWVRTPFLWRIRKALSIAYRRVNQEITTQKELAKMAAKRRQLIKEAGKTKEISKKRKWAKRLLKSKNKTYIISEIKKAGFAEDPQRRIGKVPSIKLLEENIGYIAEHKDWGIESASGLPELGPYECLNLCIPNDVTYYFYKQEACVL